MWSRRFVPLLLGALLLGASILPCVAQSVSAPVLNPENGHWYVAVVPPCPSMWHSARDEAAARTFHGLVGHLATLNTETERQFVAGRVLTAFPQIGDWWIGAYQDLTAPDYTEPAGGWRWVTGEPWSFTGWEPDEPNNSLGSGQESVAVLYTTGRANDLSIADPCRGYVVEYEPTAGPTPPTGMRLQLAPNPVSGNQYVTGLITLTAPAGPGGLTFNLSSFWPEVALPIDRTATVPEGERRVAFPIALGTTHLFPAQITADSPRGSVSAMLRVLPAVLPDIPIQITANGHWYLRVLVSGTLSWHEARLAAQRRWGEGWQGHLATLTTPEERQSVLSYTGARGWDHWWLGGYRDENAPVGDPSGGWRWITGEPWEETNWLPGQPDNATGSEVGLSMTGTGLWEDSAGLPARDGYIVEIEPINPDAPIPPSAPDGPWDLNAQALSPTKIRLSWTDNSADETHFVVWRKSGAADWAQVAVLPADATRFEDEGVSGDTGYLYRVQAINDYGPSFWSNEAVEVTPAAAPDAPTDLRVSACAATRVDLTWSDHSSNETAFAIWRNSDGEWMRIGVVAPDRTRFSDTGLPPNCKYLYRARATNNTGASAWSNEVSATTLPLAPAVPTGLTVSARLPLQLDLAWRDSSDNETAFAIWRRSGTADWVRVAVVVPNTTRYTDRGLIAETTYTFRVRATNNGGASAWTSEVTGTALPAPPSAPTGLTVQLAAPTRFELTWTDHSENETAFAIWRRTGAGDWTRIGVVVPNTTHYQDLSVSPETTYTYRVRATNNGGASAWSNEVIGTTVLPAPSQLVVRNGSPYLVYLEWTDSSRSESGFELYRRRGDGNWGWLAALPPDGNAWMDYALEPGSVYTYRVRAIGPNGPSSWSNEVRWTVPVAQ